MLATRWLRIDWAEEEKDFVIMRFPTAKDIKRGHLECEVHILVL